MTGTYNTYMDILYFPPLIFFIYYNYLGAMVTSQVIVKWGTSIGIQVSGKSFTRIYTKKKKTLVLGHGDADCYFNLHYYMQEMSSM